MEHDRHRFASLGLTAALSMLAAAPALASQGSALPCSGYWAGEMRGPHGRMLDRAGVEMQFVDCGRSLHVYTKGEARKFTPVAIGIASWRARVWQSVSIEGVGVE